MSRLTKTIEYRHTEWLVDSRPLEDLLVEAWEALPRHIDRTVKRYDGAFMTGMKAHKYQGGGFAIHCAKYVDKQSIGTVPMTPATEADLAGCGKRVAASDVM